MCDAAAVLWSKSPPLSRLPLAARQSLSQRISELGGQLAAIAHYDDEVTSLDAQRKLLGEQNAATYQSLRVGGWEGDWVCVGGLVDGLPRNLASIKIS